MLVRTLGALALILGLCAPFPASATPLERQLAAKRLDRDGYAPRLLRGAPATVDETEPNDLPADADAVAVGDLVRAGVGEGGDEDWFRFTAGAGGWVALATSSLDGSATDTVLEVYDHTGAVLLASDDDGGVGLFSALPHLQTPTTGPWLVRVRHFSALGGDAYRLTLEEGTPPPSAPSNDVPSTAILAECNNALAGTTVGAGSALAGTSCLDIETPGGEVFYRVSLPYSYRLDLQVTPDGPYDPAVAVFLDPQDPVGSCVVGADLAFAGESETLMWTNEDHPDGVELWIAVDSWTSAIPGEFVMSVTCDLVVSTEASSWGTWKSRY